MPTYHEGTMLYWLGRQEDALTLWQNMIGSFDVPGLYRKVATAYTRGRLAGDVKTAIDLYMKAAEQDPEDVTIYHELDDLYNYIDDNGRGRRSNLRRARELFPEDDQILLRTAIMYADRRQAEQAAELLETHQFKRAHQSRELYRLASEAISRTYTSLAAQALQNGDNEKALEYLDKVANAREIISAWFD
jgi:tetratricopeptide (TPR) repeat protein